MPTPSQPSVFMASSAALLDCCCFLIRTNFEVLPRELLVEPSTFDKLDTDRHCSSDGKESFGMPGASACTTHGRHVGLDELFPGSGIGDAWDSSSSLRRALRSAVRCRAKPRSPPLQGPD